MTSYRATSAYQAELGFPMEGGYRQTPEGQPKVPDLVRPGMIVQTSYDTGGCVAKIMGPYFYVPDDSSVPLEHYTIVYVPPDRYGRHREHDYHWLNELVAVDGRILQLFEANPDETFIVDATPRFPEKRGQLSLF